MPVDIVHLLAVAGPVSSGTASRPWALGVIARHADGGEVESSTCGHLLQLDGLGHARIDTPDGAQAVPLTGLYFVHDP